GHPIVLAAGLETIHYLEEDGVMEQLAVQTNILRTRLEKLYASYDIPMQTIGMGSIFNIILTHRSIKNYRNMWKANKELRQAIEIELLDLGIFLKPLNRYSMSTAHNEEDMQKTIHAKEVAIRSVLYQQQQR